jgi:hypothetical protein
MDGISKLQELYNQRDATNAQIEKIEALLGAGPSEPKQRRTRGPNRPKEPPPNEL